MKPGRKPSPAFIELVRKLKDDRKMTFRAIAAYLESQTGKKHYLTTLSRAYHWDDGE